MSRPEIQDKTRGKGHVQKWGIDETKTGKPLLFFIVHVDALAEPETYGDDDYVTLDKGFNTKVTMTLSAGGKVDWIFETVQKLVGSKDIDLERLDPDHAEPYDLEGKAVELLFKENRYTPPGSDKERINYQAGFLFPKERKKGSLSAFGAKLMDFRLAQLKAEAATQAGPEELPPQELPQDDDVSPPFDDGAEPAPEPARAARTRSRK